MMNRGQTRSTFLGRIYKVPVFGYLVRVATAVANLPRIMKNLYALQDQVRQENGSIKQMLGQNQASTSGHTQVQADQAKRIADLTDRLAGAEKALSESNAKVRSSEQFEDLRNVVVRLLGEQRDASWSAGQNMSARRGDSIMGVHSLVSSGPARHPRGALQSGADVLAQVHEITTDEGAQRYSESQIQLGKILSREDLAAMKVDYLEARIRELESSGKVNSSKSTPVPAKGEASRSGDLAAELVYLLAAKNVKQTALIGADLGWAGSGIFDTVKVRNSMLLTALYTHHHPVDVTTEALSALHHLPTVINGGVRAVVVGPFLERLPATERAMAIRSLQQSIPRGVLLAVQVGSAYWSPKAANGDARDAASSAPTGSSANAIASDVVRDLAQANFEVQAWLHNADEAGQGKLRRGALIVVSKLNV